MDQLLHRRLSDMVSMGGEAYIRNLAAAEAAVRKGQFNLAKILRAGAHSQRVMALVAARLLPDEGDPAARLRAAVNELQMGETGSADSETEIDIARLLRVHAETRRLLQRAAASLDSNRDVSENDVAQSLWGCYGCGYLAEGNRPDACPVCGALSVEFDWFGPFYSSTPEHLGQLLPPRIVEILAHIPDQVAVAVSSVPDDILRRKPAADQWSVKEIIGHMLETDLLFARRVAAILGATGVGEVPRTIPPWKLHEGKGYEDISLAELLQRHGQARASTMELLQNLAPENWTRQGLLGGSTVSVLDLGTWVANHDLGHLAQIEAICSESK